MSRAAAASAVPGSRDCRSPEWSAAIIVYLYVGQFLSKQRTAQALAELFSVRCRRGRWWRP